MLRTIALTCLALSAEAVTNESPSGTTACGAANRRHETAIRIDNTAGETPLSDYQIRVVLNSANFDFRKAQCDGRDLRFADADGETLLPYWIQKYDASAGEAVVWVRVSSVPASASKTIFLRHGSPAAESASDGEKTFEFFDDCEVGAASAKWESVMGGPRFEYVRYWDQFGRPGGVWHASGCTRRVSPAGTTVYGGAHATYCAWTRPMAIYAPSPDKTYFVFGNADNSPTICCYDHQSKSLDHAVVMGANSDGDAHRNPHLLIDDAGYLYAFYGSHCSPTRLVKSARPYDISEWTPMGVVAESSSYPQPWQLRPGEIAVLYREGGTHDAGEACVTSRDGGRSWSPPRLIASSPPGNGFYAVSIAETGEFPRKVHLAWSVTRGDWWQRYHVFYAYSDDGGVTWKRTDGSIHSLPITEPESEMIFRSDTPDRGVWLKDIQLDSDGSPYILFVDGHTLTYQCVWRLAACRRGKWTIREIAPSDHMYDAGSLVFLADDDLRAYLPTTPAQPYEDGGDIDEWQSTDRGRTWSKSRTITSGSKYSHNHVKTVFRHQKGDFRVFWSYGDAKVPPESREVDLYRYGEELAEAEKMDLSYSPVRLPGRFLMVSQPERIDSVIRVKNLDLQNLALDARVSAGPPDRKHPMLCLRVSDGPRLYGAGLPDYRGKLYELQAKPAGWTHLLEGRRLTTPQKWHDWSYRAFDDQLQLAVDEVVLAESRDAGLIRGTVGVRVWFSSLCLDDIRVRKLSLPEPSVVVDPRR